MSILVLGLMVSMKLLTGKTVLESSLVVFVQDEDGCALLL